MRRRALQFACAWKASVGLRAAPRLNRAGALGAPLGLGTLAAGAALPSGAEASAPSGRPIPSMPPQVRRLSFKTSDGLTLSFLDSGRPSGEPQRRDRPPPQDGAQAQDSSRAADPPVLPAQVPNAFPTLVFIPGWLMPADIFVHQVAAFAPDHRVVVLDPRSQGQSALHASTQAERLARDRARDIHELIEHLQLGDLVLIGWSLGVLESLDCIRLHGIPRLRGLVLIDNSVGEGPAPAARKSPRPRTPAEFDAYIEGFVQAMIRHEDDAQIARSVRQSALRLRRTPARAFEILGKPWPRETYRQAVYDLQQPVWYAITPRYRAQGERLTEYHRRIHVTLYEDATHAIFIDQPVRFNTDLRAFLESVY